MEQTQVSDLKINRMTMAQYNSIEPSSTELYFIVDEQEAGVYTETNPALTSSNDLCLWNITHNLGNNVSLKVYEVATSKEVLVDTVLSSGSVAQVQLFSPTNILAGTYKVVVVGG